MARKFGVSLRTSAWITLVIAGCVAVLPRAVQAQAIELLPAWDGRFAKHLPTQMGVRLLSPIGGKAHIHAISSQGRTYSEETLDADRAYFTALPVNPGPDGKIVVNATLPGGLPVAASAHLVRREKRFAVQLLNPSGETTQVRPVGGDVLQVAVNDLPRTAAGYGPIGHLEVDPSALIVLEHNQIAALTHYLAACRPLLLRDGSEELLERLRKTAGCAGRYLTAAAAETEPPATPAPNVRDSVERRWLEAFLITAEQEPPGQWIPWLLPYPLLLLALTGARRLGAWLLILPPVAALVYLWVLPSAGPHAMAFTLARAAPGDIYYRYTTLLELRGNGRAQEPLRLESEAAVLQAADTGPMNQAWDAGTGTIEVSFPDSTLQRRRYILEAARPAFWTIDFEMTGHGTEIVNSGPDSTPPGWLLQDGRIYRLPAVPAGKKQALITDGLPVEPPADWPAHLVTTDAPQLIFPLPRKTIPDTRVEESGWLILENGGTVR